MTMLFASFSIQAGFLDELKKGADALRKGAQDIKQSVEDATSTKETIEEVLPEGEDPQSQDFQTAISHNQNAKMVQEAQSELRRLGYQVTVDGAYGPGTRRAITQFQKYQRLNQTGDVTPELIRKLKESKYVVHSSASQVTNTQQNQSSVQSISSQTPSSLNKNYAIKDSNVKDDALASQNTSTARKLVRFVDPAGPSPNVMRAKCPNYRPCQVDLKINVKPDGSVSKVAVKPSSVPPYVTNSAAFAAQKFKYENTGSPSVEEYRFIFKSDLDDGGVLRRTDIAQKLADSPFDDEMIRKFVDKGYLPVGNHILKLMDLKFNPNKLSGDQLEKETLDRIKLDQSICDGVAYTMNTIPHMQQHEALNQYFQNHPSYARMYFSQEQVCGKHPDFIIEELMPVYKERLLRAAESSPTKFVARMTFPTSRFRYDFESGTIRLKVDERLSDLHGKEFLHPYHLSGHPKNAYLFSIGTKEQNKVKGLNTYRFKPDKNQAVIWDSVDKKDWPKEHSPYISAFTFDEILRISALRVSRAEAENILKPAPPGTYQHFDEEGKQRDFRVYIAGELVSVSVNDRRGKRNAKGKGNARLHKLILTGPGGTIMKEFEPEDFKTVSSLTYEDDRLAKEQQNKKAQEALDRTNRLEILGIRIGMTVPEAKDILTEHHPDGLTVERRINMNKVAKRYPHLDERILAIPYYHFQIVFVRNDGNERITLVTTPDEKKVAGIYRELKLPGNTDISHLGNMLIEKYLEPDTKFSKNGQLNYFWGKDEKSCVMVDYTMESPLVDDKIIRGTNLARLDEGWGEEISRLAGYYPAYESMRQDKEDYISSNCDKNLRIYTLTFKNKTTYLYSFLSNHSNYLRLHTPHNAMLKKANNPTPTKIDLSL